MNSLEKRLMLEYEIHQTVYDDDRLRKALFKEAANTIKRWRAALDWYAEPGHWYAPEGPEASVIWQGGKGEKARVALGSVKDTGETDA